MPSGKIADIVDVNKLEEAVKYFSDKMEEMSTKHKQERAQLFEEVCKQIESCVKSNG